MMISIVIPIHNEAIGLVEFHRLLRDSIDTLPHVFDIWYINDGSTDETVEVMHSIIGDDRRVHLVNLSRNFGKEAALTAGLDFANGDAVITMDGDGQHAPHYIPAILQLYDQGFDIVLTQRSPDLDASLIKRITSRLFYPLINLLSDIEVMPGATDFRLMNKDAVSSFRQLPESHRFLRALVGWMGFRWTILQIEVSPRIAGSSKYSMRKVLRLAYEAIFSFGTRPIRFAIMLGFLVLFMALIQFLDPLISIISGRTSELVPGWTTLIISVLILGATQLITLAIVGQYVGLIYEQVKQRPLYLLREEPIDHQRLKAQDSQ
ncbi:MAG: glycosyltransferase family 2 protein [Anaerolineales bacterium]